LATNGKDAIAEAIATQPDVAVLDYRLPLLNGIETTQQIHGAQRPPAMC
jgi:CheY-like chemotaxis protein